ncbi:MAG: AAA family ATPase [Segetibacter sp.]
MAKIHSIKIINFRGIKGFSQSFTSNLVCIIGRGDSGKSTILDAILNVLSPSWNITFHDNDFFNCNTSDPINIEATVTDLPEAFLKENKFGLYIRGLAKATNAISDEIEDDHEKALTIQLIVKKDLEPKWFVINGRQSEPIAISAYDRAKPNAFMISDYIDRHFSWSKGIHYMRY